VLVYSPTLAPHLPDEADVLGPSPLGCGTSMSAGLIELRILVAYEDSMRGM
jgi:hypothetical protein